MDEVIAQRRSESDAHFHPSPTSASLAARQPTPHKRRLVAALCIAYLLAMVSLVPFATERLADLPAFTGIFATAVFIADICTFVLLAAQFRAGRERWLLMLASAYLFSGVISVLHLFTFPGSILPASPLMGTAPTAAWLIVFWTLGFVLLVFAAVLMQARGAEKIRPNASAEMHLVVAVAGVLGAAGLLYFLAAGPWLPPPLIGGRFSALNTLGDWCRSLLGAAALAILWRSSYSRNNAVYLWLSLALVAAVAAPVIAGIGGQRYTFGWYAGRLGFLFASWVLLCVLLAEFVRLQHVLARSIERLQTQA